MHVLSRNGTAVTIKWAAPERKNGKLLGYQLYILYKEEKTSVNITDGHTNTFQIAGLSELLSFQYFILCNFSCVIVVVGLLDHGDLENDLCNMSILLKTASVACLLQL